MRYFAVGHIYGCLEREQYMFTKNKKPCWLKNWYLNLFTYLQIREKLTQLQEKRDKINKKWQDKMDHLQIGMHASHFWTAHGCI